MKLLITSLILMAHCYGKFEASIWTNKITSANYSVIASFFQISTIQCVSICSNGYFESCNAVLLNSDKRCDILTYNSDSVLNLNSASSIYQPTKCIYAVNPCLPNPCNGENNTCHVVTEVPNCFQQPFQCVCEKNKAGSTCEMCAMNFTGPNCSVDISDTILLDGVYFHVVGGINVNGKDDVGWMRPNCIESRHRCRSRGMRLLTIKTGEKNLTVSKLQLHNSNCTFCFYQMDLQRNNTFDETWWWSEDPNDVLQEDLFEGWYYGQPDNFPNETYAAFSPVNGYSWADVPCNFPAYYICEYEP